MSKLEIIKELKDQQAKLNSDQDNMFINVLIRDKKFKQFCGKGQQKIRWLTDCAIYKYEISSDQKVTCGPAYGLKMENGSLCDLNKTIASTLTAGMNVLVLLKEEFDVEMEEKLKNKGPNGNQINLVNNFYDEPNDNDYDDGEEGMSNGEGYDGGRGEEEGNDSNEGEFQNEEEQHYLPRNDYDKEYEFNQNEGEDD